MSNLRVARIINDFRLNGNNNFYLNNNFRGNNFADGNNINNNLSIINDLSKSINKKLSQSVLDLMNCFICLTPVQEPLTCPKCNNFGCKKCLEAYFGNSTIKSCPICKQNINLNELKQNIIIKEIEEILNKNDNKKKKFKKLSKLILKKKQSCEAQASNTKIILDKIFKYQESVKRYREEYELFLIQIQKIIDEIFNDYNNKIEKLLNSLLSYNKINDTSIRKFNDIYRNNENSIYNNNNIKNLINEILSLERIQFNNHNDIENLLNVPIKIVPSINLYHLKEDYFIKPNLKQQTESHSIPGTHFRIGSYELKNTYEPKEMKCYCKLRFNLNDEIKKMGFLISQIFILNNKETLIPMKLITQNGKEYAYECQIILDEINLIKSYDFKLKTEVLIFAV